jgi:hypothetical protein
MLRTYFLDVKTMFATMSSQVAALTLAGDVGLDIGFLNHPIASKRRSNV